MCVLLVKDVCLWRRVIWSKCHRHGRRRGSIAQSTVPYQRLNQAISSVSCSYSILRSLKRELEPARQQLRQPLHESHQEIFPLFFLAAKVKCHVYGVRRWNSTLNPEMKMQVGRKWEVPEGGDVQMWGVRNSGEVDCVCQRWQTQLQTRHETFALYSCLRQGTVEYIVVFVQVEEISDAVISA